MDREPGYKASLNYTIFSGVCTGFEGRGQGSFKCNGYSLATIVNQALGKLRSYTPEPLACEGNRVLRA